MELFIDKPDILLKQIWNDRNIHLVQKQYSLGKDKFCLIDFSIAADGQDQDKIYIDSIFYRKNIRRGNTIVQLYAEKGKQKKKTFFARKGTQKIIDIRLEYVEHISRGTNLSKDQKKAFQVIFRNVIKTLQHGKRVQLLKTQKANGQNAQISYFYDLDAWIICSKNVSMIVSNEKDLQIYEGKRYSYAKQIGKQWFKQIKHLNKQKLSKLKKFLDQFTLVGQYCGNPNYQHLILYDEIKIIWFALVDNLTEQYCIDPQQVKKNVQEFGFKFVKIKRLGSFNDKKMFFNSLEDLYIKIAEASMENKQYGEEGSIVYFVAPQMKGNKLSTKVLGSGKLKTIQYRFFRKIRQKLSRYLNKKQSQIDLLQNYRYQCQQLQKANCTSAPYPPHYYSQILTKGCQLIRQTKISQDFLRSKFVTILKLLFYTLYKNINFKNFGEQMLKNQKFLQEITKIPLYKYGSFGCDTKIIYIPVLLPKLYPNKQLSEYLSQHFNRLNLPFNLIKPYKQDPITKIYQQINDYTTKQQKFPLLINFYINQYLQIDEIMKILQKLKYKGKRNIYHKIVLITDKIKQGRLFEDQDYQYPFKIESIMKSYFNSFLEVKNCPTIQEKINQLKKTTKILLKHQRFLQLFRKNTIENYQLSINNSIMIDQKQKLEIQKIIVDLLTSNKSNKKQYQNYCKLILKLQKLKIQNFYTPTQQQINTEVKNLIKSNFHEIPELDFKK